MVSPKGKIHEDIEGLSVEIFFLKQSILTKGMEKRQIKTWIDILERPKEIRYAVGFVYLHV